MYRVSFIIAVGFIVFSTLIIGVSTGLHKDSKQTKAISPDTPVSHYWFVLNRKSNTEVLYKGLPGNPKQSRIIKTFEVKVGIPGERPTPLPELVGRDYWTIINKEPTDNPETGPYFLTLDVPTGDEWPYGPTPYLECDGQCDWVTVGYFGLHGVGGDSSRLSEEDPGSSGCIRHSDHDITYLYNLLHPQTDPVRYYIRDI